MLVSTFCIFSTFYPPHVGGVERYAKNLAAALDRQGERVVVVTSAVNDDVGIARENGIEVVRLPSIVCMDERYAIPKHGQEKKPFWEWLVREGIDRVLVNQRFYPLCLAGMRFACEHDLPLVALEHGSGHLAFGHAALDGFVHLYEHGITFMGKRFAPRFCGVSQKSVEWLGHFGIEEAAVLHNAIDAERFRSSSTGQDYRALLGIPADAFHIAFVGRLLEEKGVLTVCRAVEELVAAGKRDMHLTIAGAGPLKDEVLSHASQNVHYAGCLDESRVSALLSCSDSMCLPSHYPEGFPTSLLEAAAWGLGIITSDVGGAKELVPSHEFGIVLPDPSIGSVKAALGGFYNDRERMKMCGANVRRRAQELFNWDQTARDLVALFRGMERTWRTEA